MARLLDNSYKISPIWLQNIGISIYGLTWRHRRYGGNFKQYVAQFTERDDYTTVQWKLYQTEQLRLLLVNAKNYVPYYRELFNKLKYSESDLMQFTLDDLPNLPILEKEQIRSQPDIFISDNIPLRNLNKYQTSGTTGTPLLVLSATETDRQNQAAYEVRVRHWAGLNRDMSRAMIGGRVVVPRGNSRPPFWRRNIFERQLYFSAFHIAPEYVSDYVRALNHFQPDYLVGYASSHYFLARMIAEQGLKVYKPKAVLTSSENLSSEMRNTISNVYNCPVFDGYSGVEACCLISECEKHKMHESPDVGIIELVKDTGLLSEVGESGEIIATGLLNFEQPLIRYRTGDIAIRSKHSCECGRQMNVFQELIGRLEDTVVGLDGREMVRFHGVFVGIPYVREGQIIQKTVTDFLIRLVVDQHFGDSEKEEIYRRFQTRLGQVNLEFEFVNKIERTMGGKFRAVISEVRRSTKS